NDSASATSDESTSRTCDATDATHAHPARTSGSITKSNSKSERAARPSTKPGRAALFEANDDNPRRSAPGGHAHHGLHQGQVPRRAVEPRVTEGEDAAVAGDQPVAGATGCRGHADDGLVQAHGAGRSVEACVTEGEDAAVRRHHPVPGAAGRRG